MAESKNQTIKQGKLRLGYLTGDAEIKRLEELRERWNFDRTLDLHNAEQKGHKEGKKEGRKEGEKIGEKQAKIEIARKMIKNDISIEKIIELTGLSREEIENIK